MTRKSTFPNLHSSPTSYMKSHFSSLCWQCQFRTWWEPWLNAVADWPVATKWKWTELTKSTPTSGQLLHFVLQLLVHLRQQHKPQWHPKRLLVGLLPAPVIRWFHTNTTLPVSKYTRVAFKTFFWLWKYSCFFAHHRAWWCQLELLRAETHRTATS